MPRKNNKNRMKKGRKRERNVRGLGSSGQISGIIEKKETT